MVTRIAQGEYPLPGYRLIRPIGRGGFGEVWEAEAPGQLRVALKFIRVDSGHADPELRAIRCIRDVRHPHLLEMHFVHLLDDYLLIGTSLCDKSLADRLRECKENGNEGIPTDELLVYMEETALALDFLNQTRHSDADGNLVSIQHRDIKPANIFLVGDSVKVGDFGLAKAINRSLTDKHTGVMTLYYAPPEAFRKSLAKTSDQYSLAVTYYHLRTGSVLFDGTIEQVIFAHMTENPNLTELTDVERPIVARALHKDPTQRWPSTRTFASELKNAVRPPTVDRSLPETTLTRTTTVESRQDTAVLVLRVHPREPSLHIQLTPPIGTISDRASSRRITVTNPSGDYRIAISLALDGYHPAKLYWHPHRGQNLVITVRLQSRLRRQPRYATLPFSAEMARAHQLKWATFLKSEPFLKNEIGMQFGLIPPGKFLMGGGPNDYSFDDSLPQHNVRITRPFFIGRHTVTQSQWEAVMRTTPFGTYGPDYPASDVVWEDALKFCDELSSMTGQVYRLPTEAEWEFACRAGTETAYSFLSEDEMDKHCLCNEYAGDTCEDRAFGPYYAQQVGQLSPNPFGLFDMHGNVNEWCWDWFDAGFYGISPTDDPSGPGLGKGRVLRGGSYSQLATYCQSYCRNYLHPTSTGPDIGFRVVLEALGSNP